MKAFILKHAPVIIATVVISLICWQVLRDNRFFAQLESMSYDWRVRQANNFSQPVCTNLGFVYISDDTIRHVEDESLGFNYGLYWPRHVYGRVVRELSLEGAKLIAFDVLFDRLRPDHASVQQADGKDPSSDEWFARRIKEAGNVVIASDKKVLPPKLFQNNSSWMGNISAERDPDGALRRARAFQTYKVWHPIFQQLREDPGYGVNLDEAVIQTNRLILPRSGGEKPIEVPLDASGNFDLTDFLGDRIPAGMNRLSKPYTEERLWHMGIIIAARELGLDLAHPLIDLDNGSIVLLGTNGVKRDIPVDKDGFFYVNWSMSLSDSRLNLKLARQPFEALLALDQERHGHPSLLAEKSRALVNWKDKLVIIGSTATGNDLTDLGKTPLEENTYLVGVHWNVANSVIMNRFIQKASLPVELMLVVLLGLLAAYITWVLRSYVASLWILLLFAVYFTGVLYTFIHFRIWVPLVPPLLGGLLTHFFMLAFMLFFEQQLKRRIRFMFDKFVSSNVAEEVLKEEELSVTGETRRVTVLFSDIRGFTELTDVNQERADELVLARGLQGNQARELRESFARETLETVNTYLKVVANVVMKHDGHIDKFIGDCVMAFWSKPQVENPQHALVCVRAAIEIQRAVYQLNLERSMENISRSEQNMILEAQGRPLLPILPVLVVGTGINTGEVTAGYMGTDDRLNYTVFGREVNLASRLETVSGHARIIISHETCNDIRKFDAGLASTFRPLQPEVVKGIRHPVPIFEVPWREIPKPAPDFQV